MVRASSLKYGRSSPFNKKFLIINGFVFFIVIAFLLSSVLRSNDSDKTNFEIATTTSIPKVKVDEINKIGFQVFQPKATLENFLRTNVEIINEARTKSDCREVLQNYQGSSDSDEAFIDIYSYSDQCPYPRPVDAKEFSVGNYAGWVSDPTADAEGELVSILIEIAVDTSLLRIETDLPVDVLEEMISNFVPFGIVPPGDTLENNL